MKREIVLDTETTGLDPLSGDRIIEIGGIELVNHVPTGGSFHRYVNPERDVPEGALRVHGISADFLQDKPRFAEIVDEFHAFLGDSALVIHNAAFDIAFLDAERGRLQLPPLANEVIDTLMLARQVHPGARVSLDALCKHYGIDLSRRTLHGALLDSQILAEVYLELIGGRQVSLLLDGESGEAAVAATIVQRRAPPRPGALVRSFSAAERAAHDLLVASLGEGALWRLYEE